MERAMPPRSNFHGSTASSSVAARFLPDLVDERLQ